MTVEVETGDTFISLAAQNKFLEMSYDRDFTELWIHATTGVDSTSFCLQKSAIDALKNYLNGMDAE